MLVRRQQFLQRGLDDPFPTAAGGSGLQTVSRLLKCELMASPPLLLAILRHNSLNRQLINKLSTRACYD